MDNSFEIIVYIEFEKDLPEGTSEAISYNLPYVPRIGESVFFNEKTLEKFVNDFTVEYLEETKTRLRQYSKVTNVQYQIDDRTVFVILGIDNSLK